MRCWISDIQILAGEHFVCLEVLGNGLIHDLLRQLPIVLVALEPIPGELLVKAGLAVAYLKLVRRPEAAGVRGQHLVADHKVAVLVNAELQLGVGNDDAPAQGVVGTLLVDGDGGVPQLFGVLTSLSGEALFQVVHALLEADVFSSWSPISALVLGV